MSTGIDLNLYGEMIWEGHPPTGQMLPKACKKLAKLRSAEEGARRTSGMIEFIKETINKSSFRENLNEYLEKWNQEIVEKQRRLMLRYDVTHEHLSTESLACQFIAKHIVRGKLNRITLDNELKELSNKVDAYKMSIEKYRRVLKDDDQVRGI